MTHPAFPIELSPELIHTYVQDGFVKTENVLSDAELRNYSDAVDREVAARTASDTRSVAEKTTYEQSFIQCMRLWETSPDVRPLSCHAGLAGIAAQLLGVDSVRLWQDQALYKEAGGRETTPHQDETFWPIGSAPLVSAWIPFDAVTVGNGAMAYVPGSHLAGALTPVDITHRSEPYDILRDPSLANRNPVWVEVDPGAVVWHHGFTVHQAAANLSNTARRVFTAVYIASDATRTKSWPCYPLDREGLAVGERLNGEGMPVLWPPPASLPDTPATIGEGTGPQMQ
jgi:ectoine hydroxylase-related dioxygenase (phytanoyl-CoA dioxygenase family)